MKIISFIKKHKIPITIISIVIILLIGISISLYFLLVEDDKDKEILPNNHTLQFNIEQIKNIPMKNSAIIITDFIT